MALKNDFSLASNISPEKEKQNLRQKDNPGHLIEITIRARVKRGQIKAFVNHISNELEICQDQCNEIYGSELDYTHWV